MLDLDLSQEEQEEINKALEFITWRFQTEIDAFVLSVQLLLFVDVDTSLKSLFLSGMLVYRQWLIDQGVDVLKLEGGK